MKTVSMICMMVAVLLPAVSLAQPAPVRNPVVEPAPCSVGSERVRSSSMHASGLTRVRYDVRAERFGADMRRNPAGRMVPAASASDVRRDIVVELSRGCH